MKQEVSLQLKLEPFSPLASPDSGYDDLNPPASNLQLSQHSPLEQQLQLRHEEQLDRQLISPQLAGDFNDNIIFAQNKSDIYR